MGHLGLTMDDPDYPAVDLMNYILGGGSFSSRITKIVRTDNGLAYSTSSSFGGGGGRRAAGRRRRDRGRHAVSRDVHGLLPDQELDGRFCRATHAGSDRGDA